METFSALLTLCAGNSPVTGELPSQRSVTQSFDVFFDLRPNKQLSKQSRHRWFETPSCSLLRHCNAQNWNQVVSCGDQIKKQKADQRGHWSIYSHQNCKYPASIFFRWRHAAWTSEIWSSLNSAWLRRRREWPLLLTRLFFYQRVLADLILAGSADPKIPAEPICNLSREISADPSWISWANPDQHPLTLKLLPFCLFGL